MPNEQNLIVPSSSEARKNGAKGGKKAGEVRRRKKTMKQVMDFLLEQPANTRADYEFLVEQGIDLNSLDPDFINNMLLVNAALMARAKQGDVAAVKELRDIIRDDDMLKHKIKYDNARLRLEKQKLEPVSMPDKAYIKVPRTDRLVTESTYLTVPKKWLGKPFLDDAEFLKETNPTAYENEYMGVANGTGGNVFDNVLIREITDGEIAQFDNIYNGVDWGWYPDLYAFVRVHYAPAQHTLFIWQEYTCNKTKNIDTAKHLLELGITANDLITCDSAENKSVEDYRAYGLLARGAEKGPNSREYSYKWLQSLRSIVIDNKRCPVACEEFINCEYDRDKEGNVISGYPDGNDHVIDAVRYAMERVWKRRGQ